VQYECLKGLPYMIFNGFFFSDAFCFGEDRVMGSMDERGFEMKK